MDEVEAFSSPPVTRTQREQEYHELLRGLLHVDAEVVGCTIYVYLLLQNELQQLWAGLQLMLDELHLTPLLQSQDYSYLKVEEYPPC